MALSRAQVEHVAQLARLALTGAELDAATDQLSRILEHMEVLRRLDTGAVPPTFHVLPLENVLRPDAVQESLPQGQALGNGPQAAAGYFVVPKVVE